MTVVEIIALAVTGLLLTAGLILSTRRALGTKTGLTRTAISCLAAVISLWPLGLLFARPLGLVDDEGVWDAKRTGPAGIDAAGPAVDPSRLTHPAGGARGPGPHSLRALAAAARPPHLLADPTHPQNRPAGQDRLLLRSDPGAAHRTGPPGLRRLPRHGHQPFRGDVREDGPAPRHPSGPAVGQRHPHPGLPPGPRLTHPVGAGAPGHTH